MERKYDICVIGNAIIDLLGYADDKFLEKHSFPKDSMTLIDKAKAIELSETIEPLKIVSGGSAANTAAGLAFLGYKVAFIGKVSQDEFGEIYRNEFNMVGVDFQGVSAISHDATARCFSLINKKDSVRTMATYLGVAGSVSKEDINYDIIKDSNMLYIEGYLWDKDCTKEAINEAIRVAKQYQVKIAISLSDIFCVKRHKAEFLELAKKADIIFGNETEITELFDNKPLDTIYELLKEEYENIFVITLSEKGSTIIANNETTYITAHKTENIVDLTGAGDLYASGFLYGIKNSYSMENCGKIASILASETISHIGARPERKLKELLIEEAGQIGVDYY